MARRVLLAEISSGPTRRFDVWSAADGAAHMLLDAGGARVSNAEPAFQQIGLWRSDIFKQTGKWYVEFIVDSVDASHLSCAVGLANPSADINTSLGFDTDSVGLFEDGNVVFNSVSTSIVSPFDTAFKPVRIGLACDLDTGQVWFSKAGVWLDGGDPENGVNENATIATGVRYYLAATIEYGAAAVAISHPSAGGYGVVDRVDHVPTGFNSGWYADDPTHLYRFGSETYTSRHTDMLPNARWDGRILNDPEYARAAACIVWDGSNSARAPLGALELAAADGYFNTIALSVWRDLRCRLWLGYAGSSFDKFEQAGEALIDRLETVDKTRVRLILTDWQAKLAVPMQSTLYDVSTPVVELRGKPMPLTLGHCDYVPLQRFDAFLQLYRVTDSPAVAYTELLDRGVTITYGVGWTNPTADTIERLTAPDGKQVMTLGAGSSSARGSAIELLPDFMAHLLADRAQLPATSIGLASADAIDQALGLKFGLHLPGSTTSVRDVFNRLTRSFIGWSWVDRLGVMNVARLAEPALVANAIVSDLNILSDVIIELDLAKGLSDTLVGAKNYGVHAENDIAASIEPTLLADRLKAEWLIRCIGVATLHPTYAHAIGAPPIETLLTDETQAQALIDELTGLYVNERHFYKLAAWLPGVQRLELGTTVQLSSVRFGISVRNLLVVYVRSRWLSDAGELTLWG